MGETVESKVHFQRLQRLEEDVTKLFEDRQLREMRSLVIRVVILCTIIVTMVQFGRPVFWSINTLYGFQKFHSIPAIFEPSPEVAPMYEGALENARHDGATDSDEVTSQSDEVTGQSDDTSGHGRQHEHQDVSEETPPNTFESQDGASEVNEATEATGDGETVVDDDTAEDASEQQNDKTSETRKLLRRRHT